MVSEKVEPQGMQLYRAPSLFQGHRTRQALQDVQDGKIPPLMGLYLGLSTVPTARYVAPLGFDTVWIDWEHSACGVETMTTMVHEIIFCSEGRTIPWVRVPGHDHAAIGFALDAGASVVIPQVETVEQAQHVVSAAKFGVRARGTRSMPPFRLIPGFTDGCHDAALSLPDNLNAQAAIMIQIETLQGIRNLDAILAEVPDIDVVWLGTLDARVSMNLPANGGMGGPEQEWLDAVELFEATLEKHGAKRGGFAVGSSDPAVLQKMGGRNVLNVCAADVMALMGMAGQLASAREAFPAERKGTRKEMEAAKAKAAEEAKKAGGESAPAAGESAKPLVLNGE